MAANNSTPTSLNVPPGTTVISGGTPQYTTSGSDIKLDSKPFEPMTKESSCDGCEHKRDSKEAHIAQPGEKTPKDVNIKFDMHTDESGRKEVDAKFHFEGKRDHLDDDKDDKKDKDKKDDDGPSKAKETLGKLAEVIGTKVAEHKEKKADEPEIIEPRNAAVHPQSGVGHKIAQKVKEKIGDAIQGAATEMLVRKPGDQPRDLDASIKHHLEQANRLEREAFVEAQMANDHNLRRAERKEASRRADDAKYRAKVEVATAEAEKHVLESH